MRTVLFVTTAIACVVLSTAISLFAQDPDPQTVAKMLGTPFAAQIIAQSNSPVRITEAVAFWKRAGDIEHAYWAIIVFGKNVSKKTIIALEYKMTLHNAFGEQLADFTSVGIPGPDPDENELIPGAVSKGAFSTPNLPSYSGGNLTKVSVKRIKFSDGSIWLAK